MTLDVENQYTNAERAARALYKNGVREIFGQSNPQTIMLACEELGIRQIGFRQENAGSYMAQGYGMVSGKIPVVGAQNGPAAALLVPGLAEAYKSSHAIVAIVDDVPLRDEDRNAFQELDHFELFKGVAKWVKRVSHPDRIEALIDRAFIEASSGRPGPVVLLFPKDIMYSTKKSKANPTSETSFSHYPLDRPCANLDELQKAADLISKAKRPLIYAGGGVNTSGAQNILRKIQEEFNLPVATTTMGKGAVDENHPLTFGPIGYYMGNRSRTKYLREYVKQADVILLIGNRTNQNGTDSWTLLPNDATYIHLDISPSEIGRNYPSLRLAGDAKMSLEKLYELLEEQGVRRSSRVEVKEVIEQSRQQYSQEVASYLDKKNEVLHIEHILVELNKQLEEDHIVVADASYSSIWISNFIDASGKRKFVFPRGIAGLGWGLPMAMGAKVAEPEKKVFCLCGDGGFAHVWSELETCMREGIDVVIGVINNGILGYQKHAELSKWGKHTSAIDIKKIDYVKIAEACEMKGIVINHISDVERSLKEAFQHKGSVLLDLRVDASSIPPLTFMQSFDSI
ncbi:acetolactate synthase catalytic subunit [Ureibacillus composti]